MITASSFKRVPLFILLCACLGGGPATAQSSEIAVVAGPVCDVLKRLVPATKGFGRDGARGQLVMAVAEKFDDDGPKLRQVRARMDQAATGACPKERDSMLSATKTLAQAVESRREEEPREKEMRPRHCSLIVATLTVRRT